MRTNHDKAGQNAVENRGRLYFKRIQRDTFRTNCDRRFECKAIKKTLFFVLWVLQLLQNQVGRKDVCAAQKL
jgi:hypothetical protein